MDISRPLSQIRNFAIIAHVDHGKSTLADRLLEKTGMVNHAQEQTLDANPIERERGITIKLAPVRMMYTYRSIEYMLNLIDTPGHVDFAYEVSRALAGCEGAILLVDATQGIQAQTLAHYSQAKKLGLKIIPAINKIDLPTADVDGSALQLIELLGIDENQILRVSGKSGEGIETLLQTIIEQVPPPSGNPQAPLRALVFNSDYLPHQGVRAWVRIIDGELHTGDAVTFIGTKGRFTASEIGCFILHSQTIPSLTTGTVGYVITGFKDPRQVTPGDTLTLTAQVNNVSQLAGYDPPKPMVFLSLYPVDATEIYELTVALDKLHLLDSSLTYTPESSPLMGQGFRVGFLGLLHAEIVQERLDREFNLTVVATTPTVSFRLRHHGNEWEITNAAAMPDPNDYTEILEPMLTAHVFSPEKYLGGIYELMQEKRAQLIEVQHLGNQIQLTYKLPLMEMVGDFYSRLKSISSGFASLDYQFLGWQQSDLIRLDCLLAGDPVEVLAQVVPRDRAFEIGKRIVHKLAEIIPKHQFEIAVQAVVGAKIIARATIKPFRKDVTAKLYGGDQTRKDKLLKKQKKGKKRMKQIGKVTLPSDTFWKLLQ